MKFFSPTVHNLIDMDSHVTGANDNDKWKGNYCIFCNQRLGHSISNCPSRDELKLQDTVYDLSKNTNVMALVHHIKSGIQIDRAFYVNPNNFFESVDYCPSLMHFFIKEAYSPNYQHCGNWSMRWVFWTQKFNQPLFSEYDRQWICHVSVGEKLWEEVENWLRLDS